MSSERKRAANKANAARSTGPRTTAGKSRSSRNALRHGLNVPIAASEPSSLIDALAKRLAAGNLVDPDIARTAAESQLDLQRIRRAKALVLQMEIHAAKARLSALPADLGSADLASLCLGDVARQLLKLDEYERKALSRRKKALRAIYF